MSLREEAHRGRRSVSSGHGGGLHLGPKRHEEAPKEVGVGLAGRAAPSCPHRPSAFCSAAVAHVNPISVKQPRGAERVENLPGSGRPDSESHLLHVRNKEAPGNRRGDKINGR